VLVQVLSHTVFQKRHIDQIIVFGHADPGAEIADGFRRITAAAHSRHGGHARIVPPPNILFLHQFDQPSFTQYRITQIEAGKFDLTRTQTGNEFLHNPVIERTVVFKFQGADGVNNPFQRIGKAMRKVVHRINDPLRAGAVMRFALDAVDHGIAHHDIGRGHIDFGAQGMGAVGEFAGAHPLKQIEIFFNRAVSVRAFLARFRERSALFSDFIRIKRTDIGIAGFDEFNRKLIKFFEIIGGVKQPVFPVEPQPSDIVDDRLNIFHRFSRRIGVVQPKIAGSLIIPGDAEIEAYGFGMTDMNIAVRFRRKTGRNFPVVFVRFQIVIDDVADKIGRG